MVSVFRRTGVSNGQSDGGPPRRVRTQSYASINSRRHPQTKKHKTWEGDGIVIVEGTKVTLFDNEGKRYVA